MTHAIAMGSPVRRPASYDDVLAAPSHLIAQLVDDELHLQPRPAGPHNFVASGLSADLVSAFQRRRGGPGGWIILHEPELHLGPNVVVPDLAAWRVSQSPELEAAYVTVAPAWVCEVISPSSSRLDRGPKADLYAKAGVEFMWLIEPLENLVEAFALRDGAWLRLGAWFGETNARIAPFDAIELELGPLWVVKHAP